MSSRQVGFDPYEQWLGIPPSQRPADHYRLLGLVRFETDPERIEAAADERMSLVRKHQTGPRESLTQPLLNELAAARNCLLSPKAKSAYDELLRQGRGPAAPVARVVSRPTGAGPLPPPLAAQELPLPPSPGQNEDLQESSGAANESSSLRSFLLTFLGMAAAVVLVALATYGIGRFVWFRSSLSDPQPVGQASGTPAAEVNPGESPGGETITEPQVDKRKVVVVMQEGSQDVNLTPATAVLSGAVKLRPAGGDEFLDGWSNPGDKAQWTFKLLRPGFFRLELTYAALSNAGETRMSAQLDAEAIKSLSLRPTGELTKWRTVQQTIALKTTGIHTLGLRLDDSVEAGTVVIQGVRLVPVSSAAREQE